MYIFSLLAAFIACNFPDKHPSKKKKEFIRDRIEYINIYTLLYKCWKNNNPSMDY